MVATEKLFLKDSYLTEANAEVQEVFTRDDKNVVVLDRTLFYPTSGGQMNDLGFIGDGQVLDVEIADGQIHHFVDRMVECGPTTCRINWPRRFDFMQQHTGFHILAQSFLRVTRAGTISSHLGEELSTIDVRLEDIDWSTVSKTEDLANTIIWENRSVSSYFVEENDLPSLNLRKFEVTDRPIRLVDIENFDLDPCGGTHVCNTGEVGLIKILSWERVRDCLRFTFVAGQRALKDFQVKSKVLRELGGIYSTGQTELAHAARKSFELGKAQSKEISRLKSLLIEFEVEEVLRVAKENGGVLVREVGERDVVYLRQLVSTAIMREQATLLFGHKGKTASIIFGTSHKGVDLKSIFSEIKEIFAGQGGGRSDFIQGGGGKIETLSEVLKKSEQLARKQLR